MADPAPPSNRSRWLLIAAWLLSVVAAVATTWLTSRPVPIPPPPPLDADDDAGGVPPGFATGWVHDPIAVAGVISEQGVQGFAETRAFKEGPLPPHAYLWQVYQQVTGTRPPVKNQGQVGSCVSFGTNTAVERTEAATIAAGRPGQWRRVCEEVTYGGSRVQVGGGRMRGDGSVGAWAAQFVTRYGLVTRDVHGNYDLREYSESRCREFGRAGCPKDLEPVAREHPVGTTALVRNWGEAKKALASGYGIAVCSDQGFDMRRDARGVCRPRGVWYHCMCLDGYHVDADGREYGHITNSWGANAHTGPVGWGDPNPDGFWADAKVVDRMLRAGDSWAFSDVDGFPPRALPGMADARPWEHKKNFGLAVLADAETDYRQAP